MTSQQSAKPTSDEERNEIMGAETTWIGPQRAAELFQTRPQTVWRWGRKGQIPSMVLPNGRRVYSKEWIEEYIAQHGLAVAFEEEQAR